MRIREWLFGECEECEALRAQHIAEVTELGKLAARNNEENDAKAADLYQRLASTERTVQTWQEHAGKQANELDLARREIEHWRGMYERAMEEAKAERLQLVGHLVDVVKPKAPPVFEPGELPDMIPTEIDRALSSRAYGDSDLRAWAMDQYRQRRGGTLSDDALADEIAEEILHGSDAAQFDAGEEVGA